MIPKIFHLFWNGGPISLMRYFTFASIRKTNPTWEIWLHRGGAFTTQTNWQIEKQDFQGSAVKDYTKLVRDCCHNVLSYDRHPEVAPNYQSDFFRWDILTEIGGFYMDTDQVVLRSFDDFLDFDFVYASYGKCGKLPYGPVGVLGSTPGNDMVLHTRGFLQKKYDPNNYNSIGPSMFAEALRQAQGQNWFNVLKTVNTGEAFYPMPFSYSIRKVYEGSFRTPDEAYALHWFGGHPDTQKFNQNYSLLIARESNDEISRLVRKLDLLSLVPD